MGGDALKQLFTKVMAKDKHATFSKFQKTSSLDEAITFFGLKGISCDSVELPASRSTKAEELLQHTKFQLDLVDNTYNMNYEASARAVVTPIMVAVAYLTGVCVFNKHHLTGKVNTVEGPITFTGNADMVFGTGKTRDAEARKWSLRKGYESLKNKSHTVFLEMKRKKDLLSGFVQLLAEMLVVRNNADGAIDVNGILTDGESYYLVRLEGDSVYFIDVLVREQEFEKIFDILQLVVSGQRFFTVPDEETPHRPRSVTTKYATPGGSVVETTTSMTMRTTIHPPSEAISGYTRSPGTSPTSSPRSHSPIGDISSRLDDSLLADSLSDDPQSKPASAPLPLPPMRQIKIILNKPKPVPFLQPPVVTSAVPMPSDAKRKRAPMDSSTKHPSSPAQKNVVSNEIGGTSPQGSTVERSIPRTPLSGPQRKRRAISAPPKSPSNDLSSSASPRTSPSNSQQ